MKYILHNSTVFGFLFAVLFFLSASFEILAQEAPAQAEPITQPESVTEATPASAPEVKAGVPATAPTTTPTTTPTEAVSENTVSENPATPSATQSIAEPKDEPVQEPVKPAEAKKEPVKEPAPVVTHERESVNVSFRLSKKDKDEIDAMAVEFVELTTQKIYLESCQEYYQSELDMTNQAIDSASGLNLFLADFSSFGRVQPTTAKQIGVMFSDELHPLAEAMGANAKRMQSRAEQVNVAWREMRVVRWESEQTRYELETGANIVNQLASLLSVDKSWFWLSALGAFTILLAAVLLDKRRELRRWLNGGRARKMRLSKVLFGFVIFLAVGTLIAFLSGNVIYRKSLDLSVKGVAPKTEFGRQIEELKKDVDALQTKVEEQKAELNKARKSLKTSFSKLLNADKKNEIGENFYREILAYRVAVVNDAIYAQQVRKVLELFNQDRDVMDTIYMDTKKFGKQATQYIRVKHAIRAGLGVVFLLLLMWGMFAYFNGVVKQKAKNRNTCPMCLTEGEVSVISTPEQYMKESRKYQLDPTLVPPPEEGQTIVVCHHELAGKSRRYCNFAYGGQYQVLPKLSVPTLGVPQAGKTFWMTMLYWQLNNGYSSQSKDMTIVPTAITPDLTVMVDELVNKRHLLPATQRERIPYPMSFMYKDHDPLGRTKVLTSVFDYSGEVTTDVSAEDYRRQRALNSDAFLFFIDPTYPWEPQAQALERFNSDLRTQKQIQEWRSLRLPIAICLTKIDLLPTVQTLPNAYNRAAQFYTDMERIDPTGEAISKAIIQQRSDLVDQLRKELWPEWDLDAQIKKLFGGRHMYFPMTAVGLDGSGETDLAARTLSPFGLAEPLFWVMEMNGYPTL